MGILRLRPFKNNDALYIKDWCKDEVSFYKWCAGIMGEYPLTAKKFLNLFADRDNNDGIFPFTALADDKIVGFFSLRCPSQDRNELRFGFVIVSPEMRGKGYGKEMLTLGIKFATEIYGASKLSLGVFDNNEEALRCYKSVGFVENGFVKEYDIMYEKWKCIEMSLK